VLTRFDGSAVDAVSRREDTHAKLVWTGLCLGLVACLIWYSRWSSQDPRGRHVGRVSIRRSFSPLPAASGDAVERGQPGRLPTADEIKTTDRAAKPATELLQREAAVPLRARAGQGPTQSITIKSEGDTTLSGSRCTGGLARGRGPLLHHRPAGRTSSSDPDQHTVIDDGAFDGGISLGGRSTFRQQRQGRQALLLRPVGGVQQRSNTNPTGPDTKWVGGFRVVNALSTSTRSRTGLRQDLQVRAGRSDG